jgi:Ca2+-binding RTX toxin-like protein
MAGDINLTDGTVRIDGTEAADTAIVVYDGRGTVLQINDDRLIITLTHNGATHAEAFNVFRQVFNVQTGQFDWVVNVARVDFYGYGGSDTFRNDSSLPALAVGGNGADHLVGGFGRDNLYGEEGDDNLEGRDGRDVLWGGNGHDTAYGGAGHDSLFGNAGNDWLLGGHDNDYLYGDDGHDVLAGEVGNDYLDGGRDGIIDDLWGGTGADRFVSLDNFWERRDFQIGEDHWP